MASKKSQVVLATKAKSVSGLAASGKSIGATSRSKAKAVTTLQHAPSKLMSLSEQEKHWRCKPIMPIFVLNLREHSSSSSLDADSSAKYYYGSPMNDHRTKISLTPSMFTEKSHPLAIHVMTTSATSIEEQLV
ncbi:hypothetical protein D8674_036856 [Pyrus ussuriensis x Pyrus communis]|uniref:Uncharacterized protein n=1 Tax=Pyrus ussuriensis x Pyrus communis TaxID=2448454 RepID=A0A5N5G9V2_9ROSA|nr:hypothetical protein D8674_036856 [Pyrus ussuriensis x Pyrus communis]